MAVDKPKLVLDMLTVFEELAGVKRELELTKRELEETQRVKRGEEASLTDAERKKVELDRMVLDMAKKSICDDHLYSWNECRVSKINDDMVKVTTYEEWLTEKVKRIPAFMSRNDFHEYYSDYLTDMYEREKNEKLAAFDHLNKGEED